MGKKKPKSKYFTPTNFSKAHRIFNIVLSCFVMAYGILGLCYDDVYIPGRRTPGFHFHGPLIYMAFSAYVCFDVYLMVVVVDHYDKRNNERKYTTGRKIVRLLGIFLIVFAVIIDCIFYQQISR